MENVTPARAAVVVVILLLAVVWNSFHVVQPTQNGIDLNLLTYKLGDDYGPGRWPLGLAHRIIHFEARLVTIDWTDSQSDFKVGGPITSRTKDGLTVNLEISLQYHFERENITQVYEKFGEDYGPIIELIAVDTVTREATKYNAAEFFRDRAGVSELMKVTMQADYRTKAFVELDLFQLRSVKLPQQYEGEIQATEVAKQDVERVEAQKDNKRVVGETDVLKAAKTAQKIALEANATAETTRINNDAFIQQFTLTQVKQAEGFALIHQVLENDEPALLEYMDIRALRDHPSAKSVVSIATSG